jgi:GT2 family glycosyltransferase
MTLPLISIGLVTWNSAPRLPSTLAALAQQNYPNIELVVVDNASSDDSVAQVQRRLPNVRLILNKENRGFCGGHNQAIQASQGAYYLPLNPDVAIQPDYIVTLVETLETHTNCGSAAGKLLQQPGIIDTTGLFINRRRQQDLRGHGEQDIGQYDQPGEVFGVDGAAPLYRRQMLEDIKVNDQYFDENFFAHKEDVDVAWRAQIAGWKCWYTPAAVAIHPRSFRPGHRLHLAPAIRLHAVKNRYLLLARNETLAGWRRDWLPILWYDLEIISYLCLFERSSLAAFGLVNKLWPHLQQWRTEIWKRAKTSPEELLQWFR